MWLRLGQCHRTEGRDGGLGDAVEAAGLKGRVNVQAAREGGVGHEGRTVGKGLCQGLHRGV